MRKNRILVQVSDELKEQLKELSVKMYGKENVSKYIAEVLIIGRLSVTQNKPVDRITKKQNKPRKPLTKERIQEMVRINEAKIKAKKELR